MNSYLLENHKNTLKYEGKMYIFSLFVQLQMDFVKLCNCQSNIQAKEI